MPVQAERYYAELERDYDRTIRQLVPRYDDMVACVLDLVALQAPTTVLDLGCGIGSVSSLVLERVPQARITAVDVVPEMLDAARARLAPFDDRVVVVQTDIGESLPDGTFDVVWSNLVLHNLPRPVKHRTLGMIARRLAPDGVFVWGDLIRYDDARLQDHFVRGRIDFALAAGCPRELVELSFAKEREEDHPLTIPETVDVAREAGFRECHEVWTHDTFTVVVLRCPPGGRG